MSKVKTICLIIVLFIILTVIILVSLYVVQQRKLSVSYIISQSKGPENWEETICEDEDCEDSYQIKAKKYKFSGSEYFDEIIEIDEYSGNTKQFAFRTSTGWNTMRNIEVGRIELPYADKSAPIKCSYNFRGEATWQPCTEKSFIKSLDKIYALKYEKGKNYEDISRQVNDLEKDCEADKINYVTCIQEYSKLEREAQKALKEVRNATIQLK